MTNPTLNPRQLGDLLWGSAHTAGKFLIGAAAGAASVFLPRMMLLLSVDTEPAPDRYITLFQPDFVWLGALFALAIGVICAILEFDEQRKAKEIFMTALGVPALLSGVLTTTSATNKLQKAEQEKVALLRAVSAEAGITHERVTAPLQPLTGNAAEFGNPAALIEGFTLVRSAYAQSPVVQQQQQSRFDPGIQIQRPSFVLVLARAASQDEAVRLAKQLQKQVPSAQAVKGGQGFLVVDSLTPRSEAEAVMDAIQLKQKKLNPTLLQVPR